MTRHPALYIHDHVCEYWQHFQKNAYSVELPVFIYQHCDILMADNIVTTASLPDELQELVRKAAEAKTKAHCPYSKFPVGAALLTTSNETFTGKSMRHESII